jgi:glycosyltransferase involved in cell wall biosynthesis
MKILFVLELYYPNIGGIEKLFKTLAERLAMEGHQVTVITTRFRKDLPLKEIRNGVTIRRLRISSRFMFTFFGVFGILREARRSDIIHTTSFNAAFPARLAGWLTGRKVIITFHEAWGRLWFRLPFAGYLYKRLYFIYEWLILKLRFNRYVAVSDYTAESLVRLGVSRKRITRIYNGLDYGNYDSDRMQPPDHFTFTYFGRLGISKGLDLLLQVAPSFLDAHPEAHLKLIFPRHPAGLYRRILGLLDKIPGNRYTLLHHLDESTLKQELKKSSCVVIPSYSEGFCFAAAEASALGIPIVSSGKGALPEVVSGKHIVMNAQSVRGLREALEKAYHNDWTDIPVKTFPLDETLNDYLKLYQEYLSA